MEEIKNKVLETVEEAGISRESVNFTYIFGSHLEEPEKANDIDICVSLDVDNPEEARFKLEDRAPEESDISVFENLPLQVCKQVLNGEIINRRDKAVYYMAYQTLKDYKQFKHLYRTAIGA